MSQAFEPLTFTRGPAMKNRFMLAPLTNTQSHADGTLSEDEFRWLTMRAEGGFGLTMTCAAHVQRVGQGFPGQLGAWDDAHIQGLTRLAAEIRRHDSVAIVQLHHAGFRSPEALIGTRPVGPSDDEETGSRALTLDEVHTLVADFVEAAVRCERAGFDGVELHGAHSYVICQFLSPDLNRREDEYGSTPENRARMLREIIDGIRARCRPDFCLGVRLSPERMGVRMDEMLALAAGLMAEGHIDFLDMSLWNCFKEPLEEAFKGRPLIDWFAELPRNGVRFGVAGNLRTREDIERALAAGADWVMLGRVAILHHDYPAQLAADAGFTPLEHPVSSAHLRTEGVSETFLEYLKKMGRFEIEAEQEAGAA
ncbi:MAG TPA: NADH:flavin oxidoreductase [Pseudomonadales bacterium]|nr:NADH:flavin oxidoreductase [Pseudomonadales bacterium]